MQGSLRSSGPDGLSSASPLAGAPARVDPRLEIGSRERVAAEDQIGGLLAGHDRWRIEIAVGHLREDRGVGDPKAVNADDAALRVDHRQRVVDAPHAAGAAGVEGALAMLPDESIDIGVGSDVIARLDLAAGESLHGGGAEQCAGQPDAAPEIVAVGGVGHVVEKDPSRLARVARAQLHPTARARAHRPDMDLETMTGCGRLAVIANGARQEMILDVGIFDALSGADEAAGFEMVGGAETSTEEQPLGPDQRLGDEVELGVQRHRLLAAHLEVNLEMVLQVLADARKLVQRRDPG